MSSKPNILLIMADQLSALALPAYGHRVVKAPHISALAEDGVLFENMYCNFPLCAPSRASMLTGRLASDVGAFDNAAEFSSEVPTIAHYLRAHGYRTVLSGKMHFAGADQLHGYEERLTTDIYPADFGWTPDWQHEPTHYSWSHHMASVVEAGPCERTLQMDFDEDAVYRAERKIYDLARAVDGRSFFLTVSMTEPHDPYNCLPQHWALYDDDSIDMPRVAAIAPEQMDPHSRRLYYQAGMHQYRITDARIRNARHAYYGMISYVDDQVGRLLRALQHAGVADNTIVIFTADHGDMMGERGLWYKMTFFEWSARVPLIAHWPQRWRPHRVHDPVSLVDLLPTLLDVAGADRDPVPPEPLDGRSLAPFLEGNSADARDVCAEYLAEGAVGPRVMIRRGALKYTWSDADPVELYDLSADPDERTNVAGQSRYADVEAALHRTAQARWNLAAIRSAVLASQQRRLFVYRALTTGTYASWDFQPHEEASRAYVRNIGVTEDELKARARLPRAEAVPPDFPAGPAA